MVAISIRRGLAAGALAGLLAGALGLVIGEPPLDAAIALEGQGEEQAGPAAKRDGNHASPALPTVGRDVQKAGLVAGSVLVGSAFGALFGIASAWAVGRVGGGGWHRSLKLGSVALLVLVAVPVSRYPPNPPGVGDPGTIELRTRLYLALAAAALLTAGLCWAVAASLRAAGRPRAQVLAAGLAVAALMAALATRVFPPLTEQPEVPAELMRSFRAGALVVQAVLLGGTALLFGVLQHRQERGVP